MCRLWHKRPHPYPNYPLAAVISMQEMGSRWEAALPREQNPVECLGLLVIWSRLWNT